MAWKIRLDEVEFSSDDLTLEELEAVEETSGEPWSMLNPVRSVKSAKALLAVALMRAGVPDEEIGQRLGALTVKDIKDVFDWEEDSSGPLGVATSSGSSSGPRGGSPGARRKSAKSA